MLVMIKLYTKYPKTFSFLVLQPLQKICHCLVCVEGKSHSGPKQGFLHPIEKTIPFHTLHLDSTGPFRVSSEGYKHVLIMMDGFTKYCILKSLKTLNGQELVPILRENLTLFGTPNMIVTDSHKFYF